MAQSLHDLPVSPDPGAENRLSAGIREGEFFSITNRHDEYTRAELAVAERLSPGSPFGRLVQAEAALRFDPPDAAAAALDRAAAAAKANPFAVIDRQVAALRQVLSAMTA